MNKTIDEEGIEKGRLLGRQETALAYLDERFGPVSESLRRHVVSLEQLANLTRRISRANSLDEAGLSEFAK